KVFGFQLLINSSTSVEYDFGGWPGCTLPVAIVGLSVDAYGNSGSVHIAGPAVFGNCVHFNGTSVACTEAIYIDGDGYAIPDDCDDTDPSVHPGAPETICNGVDNNCNGSVDEGVASCTCVEHAPGLVGWWKGQNDATDASGNRNDGTF